MPTANEVRAAAREMTAALDAYDAAVASAKRPYSGNLTTISVEDAMKIAPLLDAFLDKRRRYEEISDQWVEEMKALGR